MDWIIKKSRKVRYHTDLPAVLKPLDQYIDQYNWFITDLAFGDLRQDRSIPIPINFNEDYFILPPAEFRKLFVVDLQIDWAVILAIPKEQTIDIDDANLPYADGNLQVWEAGNIQMSNAMIEIVCFDSSYTILKFRDEVLSTHFKAYFEEAISLEKFKE